jgi:hypothetical protein
MDVVCSPTTATAMDCNKLKQYTYAEIRQIYYCKSYLNVKRISDLCTAYGVFVLPSITKGERSIRQCTSKLEEIRQERPGGNTWTIWRRFLDTICKDVKENLPHNYRYEYSIKSGYRISIGMIVTKYWSGVPYKGTIISNTGKYYKIQYEDNDEEELNHNKLQKYMKKNRGEGRMREKNRIKNETTNTIRRLEHTSK